MGRALDRAQARQAIDELRDDLNRTLNEIDEQRKEGELSVSHQAYLNDYAVVRMAGFLEQLCFQAISGRVGEVTGGHLQLFVNSWFYKSPNLTAQAFRDLFKRFGPEVDARIQEFLETHLNRELLNSLLETRNAVAHGKEVTFSGRGSLDSYRNLVNSTCDVVDELLLADGRVI